METRYDFLRETGFKRMKIAVEEESFLDIVDLLKEGTKPTKNDFVRAVEKKSFHILELFLKGGYNINEPVRDDYPPPLSYALFDIELTKWMIENGANPNARCRYDITPLSIAAISAPLDVIELLFDRGASVRFGQPLHYAVRQQRPEAIIRLLIQKGADVNGIMFRGDAVSFNHWKDFCLGTPLHEAARTGNNALFKLLVQNGGDESIKDSGGNLPMRPLEVSMTTDEG